MHSRWQKLLGVNHAPSNEAWRIGPGPAVRVIPAITDDIQGLVIQVKSLQQARLYLKKHGLLGKDEPAAITLAGPVVAGLNITFVE